jgi:threonine dehydrogenase-like Zn-dependent dehydrogenase
VIRMLEARLVPVDQAVTHLVPFEETPAVLQAWNREPARFTKVMVEVG